MTDLRKILTDLVEERLSVDDALSSLRLLAIQQVGESIVVDISRKERTGVPEIIFAAGKTPEEVLKISKALIDTNGLAIISRASDEHISALKTLDEDQFEIIITGSPSRIRTVLVHRKHFKIPITGGKIGILSAGTSDVPIAEEAKVVAQAMGRECFTAYDVGIAGVHRLLEPLQKLLKEKVRVIVVVAGMEGALPSLVAGLVDIPVIGVPTSIGYGIGGKGIGALIGMLQSCAPGLVVVNIDNGIGAGVAAALIAGIAEKK